MTGSSDGRTRSERTAKRTTSERSYRRGGRLEGSVNSGSPHHHDNSFSITKRELIMEREEFKEVLDRELDLLASLSTEDRSSSSSSSSSKLKRKDFTAAEARLASLVHNEFYGEVYVSEYVCIQNCQEACPVCFHYFSWVPLLVGLVLSYADVITDVLLIIQFFNHGHVWWASISIFFVTSPQILVAMQVYFTSEGFARVWETIAAFLGFRPMIEVIRFFFFREESSSGTSDDGDRHVRQFKESYLGMKVLGAVLESAPQSVLQSYVLLVGEEDVTTLQVGSLSLSIIGIASVMMSINMEVYRRRKEEYLPFISRSYMFICGGTFYAVDLAFRLSTLTLLVWSVKDYAMAWVAGEFVFYMVFLYATGNSVYLKRSLRSKPVFVFLSYVVCALVNLFINALDMSALLYLYEWGGVVITVLKLGEGFAMVYVAFTYAPDGIFTPEWLNPEFAYIFVSVCAGAVVLFHGLVVAGVYYAKDRHRRYESLFSTASSSSSTSSSSSSSSSLSSSRRPTRRSPWTQESGQSLSDSERSSAELSDTSLSSDSLS